MNVLLNQISSICSEHILQEKWLISPSLRAGHQWLEAVTRSGQAVVNIRVQTVRALTLGLASGLMAQAGVQFLSAQAGTILIGRILGGRKKEGYLFSLPTSESLCQALFATITDLRLAGMEPDDLAPERLEVEAKGKELAALLRLYKEAMKAGGLADYADVLKMAAQVVANSKDPNSLPLILLPADLQLTALERHLLQAMPKGKLVTLPVDEPSTLCDGTRSDASLLRWLLTPTKAPQPASDGTASVLHAVGEMNEVRGVLRRCLAANIPLDEVELLYTDGQTYLPLIYELARRLEANPMPSAVQAAPVPAAAAVLRVTFAEGIPVRYSRPGRLLAAWLQWVSADYPQVILVRMIQDGLLDAPRTEDTELGFARLANMLRRVPVGFGQDRYLPRLDEQIAAVEQLKSEGIPDEDGEIKPERSARSQEHLNGLKLLREMMVRLLEKCPAPVAKPAEVLKAATELLEHHARSINELDNLALPRLLEDIDEMAALVGQTQDDAGFDPWEFLSSLPNKSRVGGSGPRQGCLHCAPVLAGGHSGRQNTFILGLDDQRFPGAGLQDPILLDNERGAISAELPTAAHDLRVKLEGFARLLARLRGNISLSYSSRNLAEDREAFPSPVLLAVYRILSGNHMGDQADLAKWLGTPASFVPADPAGAIDPAEWWLWRTCGEEALQDPRRVVAEEFPHLGRGMLAATQRQSSDFTEFDGRVGKVGEEWDPFSLKGPALSPTALETAGRCPLNYFFKYVLRLESLEDLQIDPTRWLDPAQFGSLLHEVFCIFMRRLAADGKLPPKVDRDTKQLERILLEQIGQYRRLIPAPSEWAYRRQHRDLLQATRIFLAEEEDYCQTNWPTYMEASIGLPTSKDPTPLDSTGPADLDVGDGKSIRVHGRIDRIDRIGSPKAVDFAIWDYKSGSTWKFRQDPPFWQGRVLQHAIYLYLASNRLRQIDAKADVATVGYFFPGRRGNGERLTFTPQDLGAGLAILQRLCRLIADGNFLASDWINSWGEAGDCTYCDFKEVCGDGAATATRSKMKLQGVDGQLDPLRELRGGNDHV